ncbi:MAG: metallophosphoesterase [Caulobacterales bacterium]
MIHPHLWPAVIGAFIGAPLLAVAAFWLFRRWRVLGTRRRAVLGSLFAIVALGYGLCVYAFFIEPNKLVVHDVAIESADWHGTPLSIVAIGDVHLGGPHMDTARLERIVRRINAMKPDLVVLLGDYVEGHEAKAERSDEAQAEFESGLGVFAALDAKLGVIAVIGNHDVWYDRATITRALQDAGVAVLWNRNVVISRGAQEFIVAGLEDARTSEPDYAEAFDGAPDGLDRIVIMHAPDPFAETPLHIALTLAAHTHCGQVYVPFLGRPMIPSNYGQRYACGLIVEKGLPLYVTAGLGTSILPVRFMTTPEITRITLSAKAN